MEKMSLSLIISRGFQKKKYLLADFLQSFRTFKVHLWSWTTSLSARKALRFFPLFSWDSWIHGVSKYIVTRSILKFPLKPVACNVFSSGGKMIERFSACPFWYRMQDTANFYIFDIILPSMFSLLAPYSIVSYSSRLSHTFRHGKNQKLKNCMHEIIRCQKNSMDYLWSWLVGHQHLHLQYNNKYSVKTRILQFSSCFLKLLLSKKSQSRQPFKLPFVSIPESFVPSLTLERALNERSLFHTKSAPVRKNDYESCTVNPEN